MKRTAVLTAALMFAGFTSLSIAAENSAPQGKQQPVVQSKSTVTSNSVMEKKSEVLPGKEQSAAPQQGEKVVQNSAPATEKSISEKKETSTSTMVKSSQTEKKVEQKPQTAQPNTNPAK